LGIYPEDNASNDNYGSSSQNHTGGRRVINGGHASPPPGGYLEGLRTSDEIAAARKRNSRSPLQPAMFPNEQMAAGAPGYSPAPPPPPPHSSSSYQVQHTRRLPPERPPPFHHHPQHLHHPHHRGGDDDAMHHEMPPGIQEDGELPGGQPPAPRRPFNSPPSSSSHGLSPVRPEGRYTTTRGSPEGDSAPRLRSPPVPPSPPPPLPPVPQSHAPPQVGRGASSNSSKGGGSGYGYGRYNNVRLEPRSKSERIDQELQAAQKKFELRQAQLRDEQFEAEFAQSQAQMKDHGERSYGAFTT